MLHGAAAWGKAATRLASLLTIIFEASDQINKSSSEACQKTQDSFLHCFPFCVTFASGPETSCGKLIKADHELNSIIVAGHEPFPEGEVRK